MRRALLVQFTGWLSEGFFISRVPSSTPPRSESSSMPFFICLYSSGLQAIFTRPGLSHYKIPNYENNTRTQRPDSQNDVCCRVPALYHENREKRPYKRRITPGNRVAYRL